MAIKTWGKKLFYVLFGLVLLFVILFFARPLYLPDAFIVKQIQIRLSPTLGYQLSIESGRIRLVNSVALNGISLRDSSGRERASIDRLTIKYRLLPLLRRRLVIKELAVIHPRINILSKPHFLKTTPSVAPPINPVAGMAIHDHASPEEEPFQLIPDFELPLPIEIRRLKISNAGIHLTRGVSNPDFKAEITGLNIESPGLKIFTDEDFRATFNLDGADTLKLSYLRNNRITEISSAVDLSVQGEIQDDGSTADFRIALAPEIVIDSGDIKEISNLPTLGISFQVALDESSNLKINALSLELEGEPALKASATLEDISRNQKLDAQIEEGRLNLELLWNFLRNTTWWPALSEMTGGRDLSGCLRIQKSRLTGSFTGKNPELSAVLRWTLEDALFQDSNLDLALTGLRTQALTEGRLLPLDSLSLSADVDLSADSLRLSGQRGETLSFSQLHFGISAENEPEWKNPLIRIVWEGAGPFENKQAGSLLIEAKKLDLDNPLASPGLTAEGGGTVHNLPLSQLIPEKLSGDLSTAFDFKLENQRDLKFQVGFLCPNPAVRLSREVHLSDETLRLPLMRMDVLGRCRLSPGLESAQVRKIQVDLPPYLKAELSGELTTDRQWMLQASNSSFALHEIVPVIWPILPVEIQDATVKGVASVIGDVRGQLGTSGLINDYRFSLNAESLSFSLPLANLVLDTTSLRATVKGDLRNADISGEMTAGHLAASSIRKKPYHDVTMGWEGAYSFAGGDLSGSLYVNAEDPGVYAKADCHLQNLPTQPAGDCKLNLSLSSTDTVEVFEGFRFNGNLQNRIDLEFTTPPELQISGSLDGSDLWLDYGQSFRAEGLSFEFPFHCRFLPDSSRILGDKTGETPLALEDPILFTAFEHLFSPGTDNGHLACRYVRVADYEFEDIESSLGFGQGMLYMPRLCMKAYGGVLQGAISVDLTELDRDSVQYEAQFSMHDVNTSRLPGAIMTKGEDSEISAFARFRGQGLNPDSYFNLEGGLDITHIGRQVADNLLRFLDPDQTDPSIQTYRRYLKRGWGVKVFSFDVKDDFVYASITPAKPPISKLDMFILSHFIGLGKAITFGRVPLRFFLDSPLASK